MPEGYRAPKSAADCSTPFDGQTILGQWACWDLWTYAALRVGSLETDATVWLPDKHSGRSNGLLRDTRNSSLRSDDLYSEAFWLTHPLENERCNNSLSLCISCCLIFRSLIFKNLPKRRLDQQPYCEFSHGSNRSREFCPPNCQRANFESFFFSVNETTVWI